MVTGDFYCKTRTLQMRARAAGKHHNQGHDMWHFDVEAGAFSYRYGEKPSVAPAKPKASFDISADDSKRIKQQAKSYRKDGFDTVFILFTDGSIRDMRLEYPLLIPIYELLHFIAVCSTIATRS